MLSLIGMGNLLKRVVAGVTPPPPRGGAIGFSFEKKEGAIDFSFEKKLSESRVKGD